MSLSDPTTEPIAKAPGKGAVGAWPGSQPTDFPECATSNPTDTWSAASTDDYEAMVTRGLPRRSASRRFGRATTAAGRRDFTITFASSPTTSRSARRSSGCRISPGSASIRRNPRTWSSRRKCSRSSRSFSTAPNVLGIGEIGLNKNTRNELKVLEQHIDLAARHDQLILVHTPHLEDKLKGTRLILDALRADSRDQAGARDHRSRRGAHHPDGARRGLLGGHHALSGIEDARRRARSTCSRSTAGSASG